MKDVFIYDAVRTLAARAARMVPCTKCRPLNLATTVLNEIKNRNELDGHAVEDVILGNVTQVGEQGACLARTAVLASDLDEAIPGLAINRFCASGLEAVNLASNQVAGGAGSGYIAGGVESMSRVPMMSDGGAVGVDPSLPLTIISSPKGLVQTSSQPNTGSPAIWPMKWPWKASVAPKPHGMTIVLKNPLSPCAM